MLQAELVAAERGDTELSITQLTDGSGVVTLALWRVQRMLIQGRKPLAVGFEHRLGATRSGLPQVRLAKENVGDDTDEGEEIDHQYPGEGDPYGAAFNHQAQRDGAKKQPIDEYAGNGEDLMYIFHNVCLSLNCTRSSMIR